MVPHDERKDHFEGFIKHLAHLVLARFSSKGYPQFKPLFLVSTEGTPCDGRYSASFLLTCGTEGQPVNLFLFKECSVKGKV